MSSMSRLSILSLACVWLFGTASFVLAEETSDQPEVVTLEGILDMDRVAQGKLLQATTLDVDGHSYLLSYRPMPEYYAFVERRVRVTGVHYHPEGQSVGGDHFTPNHIALAPGATPIRPTPKALPAPPIASSHAELRARVGRWVRAQVQLAESYRPEGDNWVRVNLTTLDGTVIRTVVAQTRFDELWSRLAGETFTVIGWLRRPGPTASTAAPKSPPEPIAAPSFAIQAYVCGYQRLPCESNVPLTGEGILPRSIRKGDPRPPLKPLPERPAKSEAGAPPAPAPKLPAKTP